MVCLSCSVDEAGSPVAVSGAVADVRVEEPKCVLCAGDLTVVPNARPQDALPDTVEDPMGNVLSFPKERPMYDWGCLDCGRSIGGGFIMKDDVPQKEYVEAVIKEWKHWNGSECLWCKSTNLGILGIAE